VDTNLHADGDGLPLGQLDQPRHQVPHAKAHDVEQKRGEPDRGEVAAHVGAFFRDRRHDEDQQEDHRENPHGLFHQGGEGRLYPANDHTDPDRNQDDREDLNHLAHLQGDLFVLGQEVRQREAHDER